MKTRILMVVILALMSFNHAFTNNDQNLDPKNQVKQIVAKEVSYPDFAIDLGIEGTVYTSFSINDNGTLMVFEIESTNDRLKDYVTKKLKEIHLEASQDEKSQIYNMKFSFELL